MDNLMFEILIAAHSKSAFIERRSGDGYMYVK